MSALDIVIISLGGLAVIYYLIHEIRKTKKEKKLIQEYMSKGLTYNQAKAKINNDRKKKKGKDENNDQVFTE